MAHNIPPPPGLIEIAFEPKSKADRERLSDALGKLAAEDRAFRFSIDRESGQTILSGTDELHLDTKVGIIKRIYQVEGNVGAPQVAYRERITRRITVDYAHKKLMGGAGQYARVVIVAEPLPAGSDFVFDNDASG